MEALNEEVRQKRDDDKFWQIYPWIIYCLFSEFTYVSANVLHQSLHDFRLLVSVRRVRRMWVDLGVFTTGGTMLIRQKINTTRRLSRYSVISHVQGFVPRMRRTHCSRFTRILHRDRESSCIHIVAYCTVCTYTREETILDGNVPTGNLRLWWNRASSFLPLHRAWFALCIGRTAAERKRERERREERDTADTRV